LKDGVVNQAGNIVPAFKDNEFSGLYFGDIQKIVDDA